MSSSAGLALPDDDSSRAGGGAPKSSAGAPPPRAAPRPPRSPPPPRKTTPPTGLATISVVNCLAPSLLVHSRVCRRPSTYTERPLERYSPQFSAALPHTTTRCHSVRSCFWPALSVQASLVATVKFATACPLGVYRTSGSRPRLPIRMTLLTLPAMLASLQVEARTLAHGPDNGPRGFAPQPPPGQVGDGPVQAEAGLASGDGVARAAGFARAGPGAFSRPAGWGKGAGTTAGAGGVGSAAGADEGAGAAGGVDPVEAGADWATDSAGRAGLRSRTASQPSNRAEGEPSGEVRRRVNARGYFAGSVPDCSRPVEISSTAAWACEPGATRSAENSSSGEASPTSSRPSESRAASCSSRSPVRTSGATARSRASASALPSTARSSSDEMAGIGNASSRPTLRRRRKTSGEGGIASSSAPPPCSGSLR